MNRSLYAACFAALILTGACTQLMKRQGDPQPSYTPESEAPAVQEGASAASDQQPVAASGCTLGDCKNGTGTYSYKNGDRYTGGFRDGLRDGAGSYTFANGDVLNTTFQRGRAAGTGTYVFADGRVFRGEFSNTTRDLTGQGLLNEGSTSRFCTLRKQVLNCENDASGKVESGPAHLLMLFSRGDCRILRGGRTLSGGPGIPLYAGDRIESRNESVELQGRGGIAIRLRPFSVLEIPPGTKVGAGGTLYLRKGGLAVDYQGDPKKIPFRIKAKDTNFDVEGTTFTVEIDDRRGTAKVRVYEGTVSISPSIPALERLELDSGDSDASNAGDAKQPGPLTDEELQKVADAILKQTMQVGADQEASLSDDAREKAERLNAAVAETANAREAAAGSDGNAADDPNASERKDAESAVASSLAAATGELEKAPVAKPAEFKATPQEKAELKLLITIDEATLKRSLAGSESAKSPEQARAERESVRKAYDQKLDTRASALQKELAADDSIQTQADLLKRYKFLEVITFRDGKQKAGSVAAQAGSILIMHAPDGVFRLNRDDVKQIDFYDVIPDETPPAKTVQPR